MKAARAAPEQWVSRAEYRAWCAAQPGGRYERVDGHIVAMAAERVGHVRRKTAVLQALQRAVVHRRRAAAGIDTRILGSGNVDLDPPGLLVSMDELYG